jgi:hypothetical protein
MNDRREDLYNDLMLTSSIYFDGEQVFPLWEAIYAAIVSGLIVGYFAADALFERLILCVVGALFSLHWARVISRAFLYSFARHDRMKNLSSMLREAIASEQRRDKDAVLVYRLFEEEDEAVKDSSNWWSKRRTSYLRRDLPKYVLAIWVVLTLYTVCEVFAKFCGVHVFFFSLYSR